MPDPCSDGPIDDLSTLDDSVSLVPAGSISIDTTPVDLTALTLASVTLTALTTPTLTAPTIGVGDLSNIGADVSFAGITTPALPAPLTTADLTEVALDGEGTFDILMRAMKLHLDAEFTKGTLRGPEYSQVYLGGMQHAMSTAVDYLTRNRKEGLEHALLQQQVIAAQVEIIKVKADISRSRVELAKTKVEAEIAVAKANADFVLAKGQLEKTRADILQTLVEIERTKLQVRQIQYEGEKTKGQLQQVLQQNVLIQQQARLAQQQALNEAQQRRVLVATECKLRAEYDLAQAMLLKTQSERALMDQKTATELAQTNGGGTSADSVIGRQKALYVAQANGFARDAEQKAAQILARTWEARRMSDVGTAPPASLSDASIGRAIEAMLGGIGA